MRAIATLATIAVATIASPCLATPMMPTLIPFTDDPGGQPVGTSAQNWATWAYSFDGVVDGGDPITDTTGEFQTKKQTFPNFLLGGTPGGAVERTFSAPHNKPFMIPLLTFTCFQDASTPDCTDPDVADFIDLIANSTDRLFLTVNGVDLILAENEAEVQDEIDTAFIVSDLFTLEIGENSWSGAVPGNYADSFQSGFFAFLSLPIGDHTITYGADLDEFDFGVEVVANVSVVPAPPVFPLVLTGMAGVAVCARRRHRG